MLYNKESLSKSIIEWRRSLHQIPELGLYLPQTRAYICKALDEMGINYTLHKNSSAIVVQIEGSENGKTFAIRGDMDALPLREKTCLPYASQNENMHACGHDAHAAMMLGTAKILHDNKDKIKGTVKVLFQPGEETLEGAKAMISEGALLNPKVDAMISLHVVAKLPDYPLGKIGLKKGAMMAGKYAFKIVSHGEGGHMSDTANIKNPIISIARAISSVGDLEQYCKNNNFDVIIGVGLLSAGVKENIIPKEASAVGSIRYHNKEQADIIAEKLEEFCSRFECEIEWTANMPNVVNDEKFTQELYENSLSHSECDTFLYNGRSMAGDDMCYFFEHCLGSYIHINCGFLNDEDNYNLHNPNLLLNEEVFWKGSVFAAHSAIDWLNSHYND